MKRVAIIGAGASGLTAIKNCLDEGVEPVCYEKYEEIGGLWYYRENREDQGCVFKSTVINTSKEVMSFSDFPIPEEFPNYMHNKIVFKYYQLYSDRFKLRKYIHFRTKVDTVVYADDYQQTGRWKVTVTPQETGKPVTEIFDAVLVCTGHHCTPNVPEFEGLREFKGKVLHSHDYLTPKGYEGMRIMVIGVGNSGCDAAVELSREASKLFLSTRRGVWIFHRVSDGGLPLDINILRRYADFPPFAIKDMIVRRLLQSRVNHKFLGIQPEFSPWAYHPTVNDSLPNCIMNGSIIMKPDVKRFTPSGVVFQDGTTEELDAVILATGYIFRFPFLDESVLKVERNRLPLYKYVFPPHLKHPSLAFIGYVQPIGSLNPLAELQVRWAARVFTGATKLPSTQVMRENIQKRRDEIAKRYVASQRHTIQVDFIQYSDDVAIEFGVKPNFLKMMLYDPILALKCVFGPFTPYQYRLEGPGKWSGARYAIITVWDRIGKPLQTRKRQDKNTGISFATKVLAFLVVILALYLMCF